MSTDKMEASNSFKLLRETLDNSVAHAILKIVETPILSLKAFLFVCVILSSGLCSYLIIELIMSFLSFGVSTTYRTLYETPAVFPKITFCNVNPFTTKYAMEFLRQINKELHPTIDVFNDEQMDKLDFNEKTRLILSIKFKAIFRMNVLNDTEKRKLSRPLEEIVLPFSNANSNDFSWYFDPWYGNCWIYNSGYNRTGHKVPLVTNYVPGETYGLQMSLYVNFYQNLSKINSLIGGLGALIQIDNSSYLTYYISMDGIKFEPGQIVSVSVGRSFKSNLPRPYSNCLIDNQTNADFHSELFDLIQNSQYRYTQSLCFFQCWQREILSQCKCTDAARVSLLPNASKCIRKSQNECMDRLWDKQDAFLSENCSSECPLECYSDSFEVSLSSYKFLPFIYQAYLKSNQSKLSEDFPSSAQIDENMAQKSFVGLNIFYKSLSYEISTESPQLTVITLIANIGGHLGLFMGGECVQSFRACSSFN